MLEIRKIAPVQRVLTLFGGTKNADGSTTFAVEEVQVYTASDVVFDRKDRCLHRVANGEAISEPLPPGWSCGGRVAFVVCGPTVIIVWRDRITARTNDYLYHRVIDSRGLEDRGTTKRDYSVGHRDEALAIKQATKVAPAIARDPIPGWIYAKAHVGRKSLRRVAQEAASHAGQQK